MHPIASNKDLQERITYLEDKTNRQKDELKTLWKAGYESIKPQNLIKNAFSDAVAEPRVRNNMLNTSVGLLTGLLTRKLLIGSGAGIFKKIAGTAVQVGITKFIARQFPAIQHKANEFLQKKPAAKKVVLEE